MEVDDDEDSVAFAGQAANATAGRIRIPGKKDKKRPGRIVKSKSRVEDSEEEEGPLLVKREEQEVGLKGRNEKLKRKWVEDSEGEEDPLQVKQEKEETESADQGIVRRKKNRAGTKA